MRKIAFTILLIIASHKMVAETELERVEIADALAEVIGLKKASQAGFEAIIPVLGQQITALNLNKNQEIEYIQIYRDWFNNDLDHDSIHDQVVALYANTFSGEELMQLIEFYESPLGQKALSELPKLTQVGAEIGMREAQKKQQALLNKMTPFLEKIESEKGNPIR